jgi:hypothetical protein
MQRLCNFIGVTWTKSALRWEEGALPDWQTWDTKGWHDRVKLTQTFENDTVVSERRYTKEKNDDNVKNLISETTPYYMYLKSCAQ